MDDSASVMSKLVIYSVIMTGQQKPITVKAPKNPEVSYIE